jgi:hypothetical protein
MMLAHGKYIEAARVRELGSRKDFMQALPGADAFCVAPTRRQLSPNV